MSKHDDYVRRTEELLEPIAKANSVNIYDVEFVNEAGEWYLRAYIDKEGGVTIDDCEAVSRALSDEIDKYDYIDEAYYLEVSSPGLGRALKKDRHLQSALGEAVELKTFKPIDKVKEFSGILKAFDAEVITLTTDGGDREFKRSDIALIKLALDI